jgi:hypothetical protein
MVKVEIGKQYSVSNRWKKSFIENTYYVKHHTGATIEREMLWRQGTFLVTPQNQEEVDLLMEAQAEDYEGTTYVESFEEFEFDSCWDGICEDYNSDDVENIQELFDDFYDDEELQEEYFGFDDYIEQKLGYDLDYSEQIIEGSILVEEV